MSSKLLDTHDELFNKRENIFGCGDILLFPLRGAAYFIGISGGS